MTYHNPIDGQVQLKGATLVPRNWDERGEPTDTVSVHTMIPADPVDARLLLEN